VVRNGTGLREVIVKSYSGREVSLECTRCDSVNFGNESPEFDAAGIWRKKGNKINCWRARPVLLLYDAVERA
jgi:limonene-1,2-epoxide hydrolase